MKGKVLFLLVGVVAFFSLQGVGHVEPVTQMPSPVIFKADITAAQEVPTPSPTLGIGAGVFVLNAARTELAFAVSFTGLSGPVFAAHFHAPAEVGTATGVVRTICSPCQSGTLITGVWKDTDAQPLTPTRVQELLEGRVYVNAHTPMNPGGEIRGQVIPINVP